MRNKPRRAGARWLRDAPPYILDCFDEPATLDRYTVMLGGDHIVSINDEWLIPYLAMSDAPTSPQGFSQWGELRQRQAAMFRHRQGKRRVAWLDLPEHIRQHVVARVASA